MFKKNKLGKRILQGGTVFSIAGVVATLMSSCSSSLTYESSVQLIVSDATSVLADQSFSQSSYDGIRDFMQWATGASMPDSSVVKENDGIWKRPGSNDDERKTAYKYAVNNGSKIIVATGFNQQDALQQVTSTESTYASWKDYFKDTAFVFVDGSMIENAEPYNSVPYNVASISYRADDGSFLAGVSTAVFLNEYYDYFKNTDGSLGVSSFVGLGLDSTWSYMNGFRMGIHYWNAVLQPLIKTVDGTTSTQKIKWVSSTTGADAWNATSFTSGSFDATEAKATTLASNMRSNGANAIFPIAGPQTNLVVDQIASNPGGTNNYSNTITIGVDSVQEDMSSLQTKLPNSSSTVIGKDNQILQFSSIKDLQVSTNKVLQQVALGENSSTSPGDENGWHGLGWNNVGTIANGSVGVSPAGLPYLLDPFFWASKSDGSDLTTDDLKTWSNTETENKTLNELLTTNVAHSTSTDDPVIHKYGQLLAGTILTPSSITGSSTPSTTYTLGDSNADSTNGLNGWDGNGKWSIENNNNGVNDYLTKKLSNNLLGIAGATYTVASNTASWVGGDGSQQVTGVSKEDMFFRKV